MALSGMASGYARKGAAIQAPSIASVTDLSKSNWQAPTGQDGLMVRTELLHQQHDDALAMADRLMDLVTSHKSGGGAVAILMQLNRLIGLLRIHLAQEDIELYPALMESDDPAVAKKAKAYVEEMGGLAAELEIFARHWSCSASIASGIDEFREGLHQLMLALAVRIERENLHLYPLAEAEAARREPKAA
jgi:hypothetical protein